MATEKKIITVFGATGAQGGAVVRALAADERYQVRAVTRNPDSDKAKALPDGVDVVKADLADPASLTAAFAGAYGAFVVTNYWELLFGVYGGDHEKTNAAEIAQGKAAVDAAKAAGIKHFVFSALENVKEITDGALPVPHFDGKGIVGKYAEEVGLPTTNVMYSFYLDNFLTAMGKPKKQEDGSFQIFLPLKDVPMGVISVEDAGHVVKSVFDDPETNIGRWIGIANEVVPVADLAAALSRGTGKDVKYVDAPVDVFRAAAGDDFTNMCIWYWDERCVRDVEATRALYPGLRSVDDWVAANKDGLIAAMEAE
eukprot:CAMPEP_0203814992 /NCGR_PEP_ID=MMETSP0115-20131106/7257_1 /ASSEMBLY_ACC=CAM_ASM_000227 /TAXON_ID=33651 /ORGANISM="Bicosoecid sp, Strain ms1" /LENGTH=311 /DNA_ID=CAMNT_0050723879 /DNA_START=40 /DNA_END=975 /DNA_ORIENTATION=+